MKRLFSVLVVLALVFSAVVLFAEEKKSLEVEVKATSGTRYVSDFGLTYLRDPFVGLTPSFTHEKSGLYGALSMMYSPSRKINSGEPEAGWFEGWAGKTGKLGWAEYDGYVGFWSYEMDNLKNPGNAIYVGLGLKFPEAKVFGMIPFVGGEYYGVLQDSNQNGFVWRGGFEYDLLGIKLKAFATGHDRVFNSNSALLASGIVSASHEFDLYKNIKLVPSVNYQQRFEKKERDGGLSQGGFWGGLALKITF